MEYMDCGCSLYFVVAPFVLWVGSVVGRKFGCWPSELIVIAKHKENKM
jgi:hypothetical protein